MKEKICKMCHKLIAEDGEELLKKEISLGKRYIECPFCRNLEWIKRC